MQYIDANKLGVVWGWKRNPLYRKKRNPDTRTPFTGEYQAGYEGEGSDIIKELSYYKNCKLDGIQTLWHADGLRLINTYKNGEMISSEKIQEDHPINNDPPFWEYKI